MHRRMLDFGRKHSTDGIPGGAVGLDRATLAIMRWGMARWSRLRLLNRLGGTCSTAAQLDLLPGVGSGAFFTMRLADQPDAAPEQRVAALLRVSEAIQRLWLETSRLGLAMQPALAILAFAHYGETNTAFSTSPTVVRKARVLSARFRQVLGDSADEFVFIGLWRDDLDGAKITLIVAVHRQQHRQPPHPVDGQIQQLARGWTDPVGVLEDHQHRAAARLGFELVEQRLEQFLPLALRAEIEVRGGTWQRKQLVQQRYIILIPRAWRDQCPQLAELGVDRLVAGEPGGAFELRDEGIERAVLMMRRAEMAQAGMRLGSDLLGESDREPRLADARLAEDQDHSTFAALRLLPAADKQFNFLLTPNERRLARAQCLEPAQHPAFANDPPCQLRLGKTGERLRAEID